MEPLQPHQSRWYRRTDPQGRALLALLLPLAGVYLCQLVTLQEPAAAWAWMGSHAGAAGYTYLVLLLAQLLVTTLTDSLLCGQLLTLLPCLLLSVASHLKQAVNGVPLLVSDLAMAGQAGQVAGPSSSTSHPAATAHRQAVRMDEEGMDRLPRQVSQSNHHIG